MKHSTSLLLAALTALLLIGTTVRAQEELDTLWSKTFQWPTLDIGTSIAAIPGGGFAVSGFSSFYNADSQRFDRFTPFLMRVTERGDSVWIHDFGPHSSMRSRSPVITTESTIIIQSATSEERGIETHTLASFNFDGEQLWAKSLSGDSLRWYTSSNLIANEDGTFSFYHSYSEIIEDSIVRGLSCTFLASNGDSIGMMNIDYSPSLRLGYNQRLANGDGLLTGEADSTDDEPWGSMALARVNSEGASVWELQLNRQFEYEYIDDVMEWENGELAVLADRFDGQHITTQIFTVSANGQLIRRDEHTFGNGLFGDLLFRLDNHRLLLVGHDNSIPYQACILVVDQNGEVLQTDMLSAEYIFGMANNGADQIIAIGSSDEYQFDRYSDVKLFGLKGAAQGVSLPDLPLTPDHVFLSSPFPSPFNSSTFVSYSTPFTGPVNATLVDISGREVMQWTGLPVGHGRIVVDGAGLATGEYWLKLQQNENSTATKVVLVR